MEENKRDESNSEIKKLHEFMRHEVKNKRVLNWNYKNISSIPYNVMEEAPTHITQIFLKHNLITDLPRNMGRLQNLTFLYLYSNDLQILPDVIGELRGLRILDVSNNFIKTIPPSLMKLFGLKTLNMSGNELTSIPADISRLRSLSLLFLSNNEITELPSSIGKIESLQAIYVDSNKIVTLPISLAELPILTHISCSDNNLIELPSRPYPTCLNAFFDSNVRLNYIPYCFLEYMGVDQYYDPFITPTVQCFNESYPNTGSINVHFHESERDGFSLRLPNRLTKVTCYYRRKHNVYIPPLTELCLRSINVCYDGALGEVLPYGILPNFLTNIVKEGPVAYCSGCEEANIFCYASIVVINISLTCQVDTVGVEWPTVVFFCGDSCARDLFDKMDNESDDYDRWLHKRLSEQLAIKMSPRDLERVVNKNDLNS